MSAPNQLSAAAAVAQLSSGDLTAEALTRACLERAEERKSVKAWTWPDPEHALAQARAADHAGRPGLLAGLPIGIKDIIDTVDMPTEHGSPIYRTRGGPRIGICRTPAWDAAEPPVQALIEQSAARFAAAGARFSEVSFAPEFADILDHHRRIFNYEAARNYAYEYEEHHDQVSQMLRDTVLSPGRELPLAAYVEALETAEAFRRHLDDLFRDVDVLLTPSAAGEAPEGLGSTGDPSFNSIWTLSWSPC